MKQKVFTSFLILFTILFAACSKAEPGQAPPIEVTRIVEVEVPVPVVVTATPEPDCVVSDKPNIVPDAEMKWVFHTEMCEWVQMYAPEPETASTAVSATSNPGPIATSMPVIPPHVLALVDDLPSGLAPIIGDEPGRDLLIEASPSNDDWSEPEDPTFLYPIDEDGGILSLSTGYFWGTLGVINDNGDIFRFAGPWGGPNHQENYTYFIFGIDHTEDIGAHQLAGDHFPSGSVAVNSGQRTQVQMAERMYDAVGHHSGRNDSGSPDPIVGIFLVDSETGKVNYFEATYHGGEEWSWIKMTGQLPLIQDWKVNDTVFDVLD